MRVAHYHRQFPERYMADGKTEAYGELYSYSTVTAPPTEMEDCAPYVIALIRLDSGRMILSQLTDCAEEELRIGMRMEMVVRKIREKGKQGLILYGYKFRPSEGQH